MKFYNGQAVIRLILGLLGLGAFLCGCSAGSGGTTAGNPVVSEDNSASGAAAGAVGGALSSTGANGKQAYYRLPSVTPRAVASNFWPSLKTLLLPVAHAAGLCPSYKTASGSLCTASGSSLWLSYEDCEFASSSVQWTGTMAFTMSSGTASCGTFPSPGDSQSLYRQYVSAANSLIPDMGQAVSSFGTEMVVDDKTLNLHNFDSDPIAALINGGYGTRVDFDAQGGRSALVVGHRIYVAGSYDHSVTGNLTINEQPGASSRTVTGSLTVYHNALQVVGTSTFYNVTHDDQCCLPTSGYIKTVFARGNTVSPTTAGAKVVGEFEILTFTGCGTGTLQSYDGTTSNVELTHCY